MASRRLCENILDGYCNQSTALNVVRHIEVFLFRSARARVTLARMSLASAVQINGLGLVLCTAMCERGLACDCCGGVHDATPLGAAYSMQPYTHTGYPFSSTSYGSSGDLDHTHQAHQTGYQGEICDAHPPLDRKLRSLAQLDRLQCRFRPPASIPKRAQASGAFAVGSSWPAGHCARTHRLRH